MFFTQEDYIKIQQWLVKNSVKDTEFNEANIPFNGNEIVSIVQGNQNKKVFLKDLIAQVFNLGISDFVNITDKYNAPNISLEEAIRLIPSRARKTGQVITFLNKDDNWQIYQFKGALNQWNVLDTWEDLFDWEKLIIDSILPDEEDLTKSPADANGNSYLSLKDREYNPEDFSGLGRVILRKNIVEIEDPVYGKVKKNILYQDMINKSNTIYEIRYDFDLNGEEITIPEDCILDFQGGSLSNGSIVGNKAGINSNITYNIFKDCIIKDFNIPYIDIRWFGAKVSDPIKGIYNDVSTSLSKAIECTRYHHGLFVYICGFYYLSKSIHTDLDLRLKGNTYIPKPREDSEPSSEYQSAKSVIYVGGNVTAFNLLGRSQGYGVSKVATICLENLSFIGSNSDSGRISNLIYNEASGSPTRPGYIEQCEFSDFNVCLSFKERDIDEEGSVYGGLTINQCRFIRNNHCIYVPTNSKYGITNLNLTNSCCEYNLNVITAGIYGNIVINNCLLSTDLVEFATIHLVCSQTSYITITNNYFESIFDDEKYACAIYGEDIRNDKLVWSNNSYNNKIYCTNIKILNSNKLTNFGNYGLFSESKFYHCWFSNCEDVQLLKPSNIIHWCIFDTKDYTFTNNVNTDEGYIIDVQPDTILNKDGFYKKLEGEDAQDFYTAIHLPASNNSLIVQHLILDGEPDTVSNVIYKALFAEIGQTIIEDGDLYLKNKGDVVVVWNARIPIGVDQYFYMWKPGNNILFKDNAIVYTQGYNSEKRLYNFPAMSSKPFGSKRPSSPIKGIQYFDTVLNKPIWWTGTKWIDATGADI